MDESKFRVFDAAEFLDSEEAIAAYVSDAMQDDDQNRLLTALATVARARGMSRLAETTGLGRESLYKALRPGAKPRFDTVIRIMKALNIRLTATVDA